MKHFLKFYLNILYIIGYTVLKSLVMLLFVASLPAPLHFWAEETKRSIRWGAHCALEHWQG